MQPAMTPPNSGKIALREGAIIGAILIVVHIILAAINTFVPIAGLKLFVIILLFIAWLAAFLFAGLRASKQTGRVSTGTLAGLWTGVIAGVVALIVNIIFAALTTDATRVQAAQDAVSQIMPTLHVAYSPAMLVGGAAIDNTCLLLLGIGVGAGLGALGGLMGRKQANIPPAYAYGYPPEMPYPPQPYPPQQYPPEQYPPQQQQQPLPPQE